MRDGILIVEDSEDDLFFIKRVLDEFPGELVCCSRGSEALVAFDPDRFTAVFVDLGLPDMDGIELILRLRLRSAETLIYVLTGAENPERRMAAIGAGATGFLIKPFSGEECKMLMAQIMAKQIAFERGKRLKDWRTTAAGGCAAAGSALLGSIVILNQTGTIVGQDVRIAAWLGLLMQFVGILAGGWFGVDRKSLEEKLRKLLQKEK